MGLAIAIALFAASPRPLVAADEPGLAEQQAFRAAVERIAPSVVRIETIGGLERIGGLSLGRGPTTGLVVSADGYIVSSAFGFLHRPASILVQGADAVRKPARLVATDHNRMIALLKIEADKPLAVPEVAPLAEARVGQWTIAVGRTFEGKQPNMAVGLLSATNRIWGKAIQTDAAVSPNNYGGPLVDLQGRVLGVLVPLSPMDTSELAGVEWYDSGIGFAVPADSIMGLLPRWKQGKDLYSGRLGIAMPRETLYTADSTIPGVRPQSPAYKVGFRAGDRIVAIDGRPIELAVQAKQEISPRYAGDKIRIAVLRGKQRIEREIELVAKLDPFQPPFLGVLPLRPAPGRKAAEQTGVGLRYVFPGGPADKAGLARDDLLVKAGGSPVRSAGQLRLRLAELQPGDRVEIEYLRGQETRRADAILADVPETNPPGPLPPASVASQPQEGKRPQVGPIHVKSPDLPTETWAYVPEKYDGSQPQGVVVLFGPPGEIKPAEILALWKTTCDRDGLILVAPRSSNALRWLRTEARVAPPLVAQIARQYRVDPERVVAFGRQSGGAVAFAAAFGYPQLIRGVAAVEAAAEGDIPDHDAPRRLACFLAFSAKGRAAETVRGTIAGLRKLHYPVLVRDLAPEARELNLEDIAELARWIDTLDRI